MLHLQPLDTKEAGSVFVARSALGIAQAGALCHLMTPRGSLFEATAADEIGLGHSERLVLHPLPSRFLNLAGLKFSWALPALRKAAKLLSSLRFNAVICRDLDAARYLASRIDRTYAVIYEAHQLYMAGRFEKDAEYFPADKLVRHDRRIELERKVFSLADGVIVLTEEAEKWLKAKLQPLPPVESCGSATEPLSEISGPVTGGPVAYIGALDPHKGLSLLLKALTEAKNVTIKIIGHGHQESVVRGKAKALGVENRVDFAGWISPDALPKALAGCSAGVLPLVDCLFNRMITSPMKLFDYIQVGLPVIAPDLPAISEIFRSHSAAWFRYETDNPDSLAQALHATSDDSRLKTGAAAALALSRERTWENRGKKLLSFVREIVNNRKFSGEI